MDVEATVRNYIVENLLRTGAAEDLPPDASLLNSGLLDSTSIFQLVSFLETEFKLQVADEEIVPENFETVQAIVGFVEHKRSVRA